MSLPISISLDLSTASGSSKGQGKGAWDDRELIRAYDAALEEFHIHHPGPGTWLDKATAAKAQGQPLTGARAFGTSWYSASEDVQRDHPPPKRKRGQDITQEVPTTATDNPYAGPVAKRSSRKAPRAESPAYTPPSPSCSDDIDGPDGGDNAEQIGYGNEAEVDNLDGPGDGTADPNVGYLAPDPNHNVAASGALSSASASTATYEDAIAYAMSAQYAAGYWLGVAHSKSVTPSVTKDSTIPPQTRHARRRERPEPSSNVIHSRQEFPTTQATKLRR